MSDSKTCNACGQEKPVEQFYRYIDNDRGQGKAKYMSRCKLCCGSANAIWRKAKGRKYFQEKHLRYVSKRREQIRELSRNFSRRLKVEVFTAYGNKCACCGEDEIRFLTIDHIRENGAEHRRTETGSKGHRNSGTGSKMYGWLKRHEFPKDNFQLLCANCNTGKHFNGGVCPHEYHFKKLRLLP